MDESNSMDTTQGSPTSPENNNSINKSKHEPLQQAEKTDAVQGDHPVFAADENGAWATEEVK